MQYYSAGFSKPYNYGKESTSIFGYGYPRGQGFIWMAFSPSMLVTGVTLEEVALNAILC